MSTSTNSVLENWFERVWNNRDENAIDELMDANAAIIDKKPAATYTGTDHVKTVFRNLWSDFEDIHMDVIGEVKNNDDIETAECLVRAKYNDREIKFTGPAMVKVRNGKIVEASNDFDLRLYEEARKL